MQNWPLLYKQDLEHVSVMFHLHRFTAILKNIILTQHMKFYLHIDFSAWEPTDL